MRALNLEVFICLTEFFKFHETDVYVVGGFLRDSIVGKPSSDIDLAVSGDVASLARKLADSVDGSSFTLDGEHRLFRVHVPHRFGLLKPDNSERQIVQSNNGQRNVSPFTIVDMHEFDGDLIKELSDRDFTIDAMAIKPEYLIEWIVGNQTDINSSLYGNIIDPFNGLGDLKVKSVKVVSNNVFANDPVRLIRAVRIAAQLGFSIEKLTRGLIRIHSSLLGNTAPERLRDELLLIMDCPEPAESLYFMDELGLLKELIPELTLTRGVVQPIEHHWDVFNHCIETLRFVDVLTCIDPNYCDNAGQFVPWHTSLEEHFLEKVSDGHSRRTIMKLAGLLHDISKPQTKTTDPVTGRMRFIGHDREGAEICRQILGRLRFSGKGIDMICSMVRHHMRPTQLSQGRELPTNRAIYRYYRDLGAIAIDTLYLNLADYRAAKGPNVDIVDWHDHCDLIAYILERGFEQTDRIEKTDKLLDGRTLMKNLDIQPGIMVGRLLRAIDEAHALGEVSSEGDAIIMAKEILDSLT